MKYALLSLDLDNKATTKQRNIFNDYLENENWIKISKVNTTWYTSSNLSEREIINETKKDVSSAVKQADIISYDAVVNVSILKPVFF